MSANCHVQRTAVARTRNELKSHEDVHQSHHRPHPTPHEHEARQHFLQTKPSPTRANLDMHETRPRPVPRKGSPISSIEVDTSLFLKLTPPSSPATSTPVHLQGRGSGRTKTRWRYPTGALLLAEHFPTSTTAGAAQGRGLGFLGCAFWGGLCA